MARRKTRLYNEALVNDMEKRFFMLKGLFGAVGKIFIQNQRFDATMAIT